MSQLLRREREAKELPALMLILLGAVCLTVSIGISFATYDYLVDQVAEGVVERLTQKIDPHCLKGLE